MANYKELIKNISDIELIHKKHQQECAIMNQENMMVETPEYFSHDSYQLHIEALEMIKNEMARRVGVSLVKGDEE